jgi:hypothetical protein
MSRKRPKPKKLICRSRQGEVKVIYPTELDAKIEVASHVKYDTDSRYYKCRWHNHYHVSTQAQLTEAPR